MFDDLNRRHVPRMDDEFSVEKVEGTKKSPAVTDEDKARPIERVSVLSIF